MLMESLREDDTMPWLCGGDFNLMLASHEKKGGGEFKMKDAEIFREAVHKCNLVDLGNIGYEFTWSNNQGGEKNLQERLDRFLATHQWKNLFPGSFVSHLEKRKSDHLPIVLCIKGTPRVMKEKKRRKLYRFEEMWVREDSCKEIIQSAWHLEGNINSKISCTASRLTKWSKEKFGNFARVMRERQNKMGQLMEQDQPEDVIAQMRALDDRMDELEMREEVY